MALSTRWRAREIAHHRFERRRLGRLGRRQEALRRERVGELPTLADALGALALGALVVVDAERLAQIGVEAAPPAAKVGRSWVVTAASAWRG